MEIVWLQIVFLSVLSHPINAFYIQIFDQKKFQGLFHEERSLYPPSSCSRVTPGPGGESLGASLKADDCLMLYADALCSNYSIKIDPGEYADIGRLGKLNSIGWNPRKNFRAYSACEHGGPSRTILYKSVIIESEAENLIEFLDVCDCITLPIFAQDQALAISNVGSCVKLFKRTNCVGPSLILPAGRGPFSDDLQKAPGNFGRAVKSLSACEPLLPPCVRFDANVVKFKLAGQKVKIISNSTDYIDQIGPTAFYRNNASVAVTTEYQERKKLEESVVVNIPKLSNFDSFVIADNLEIETNMDFSKYAKSKITNGLRNAYNFEEGADYNPGFYGYNPKSFFKIKESVQVPPCTLYSIRSNVIQLERYKVKYEVHGRVTGMMGHWYNRKMNSVDLKKYINGTGLTYTKEDGSHAVLARLESTLTATIGVAAVIDNKEEAIDGCEVSTCSNPDFDGVAMAIPFVVIIIVSLIVYCGGFASAKVMDKVKRNAEK